MSAQVIDLDAMRRRIFRRRIFAIGKAQNVGEGAELEHLDQACVRLIYCMAALGDEGPGPSERASSPPLATHREG
jgi:hypothetical protein